MLGLLNKLLRNFVKANQNLCWKIAAYLPQANIDLLRSYEKEVAHYMNSRPGQIIVDIGGGRSCPFAKHRDPAMTTRIVAVDVSEEEMKHNQDVDEHRTANVMQGLPFGSEEVDLVTSRFVLEHLGDLEAFVSNSGRNLKRGGYSIHVFPSKFAPFALINQALPKELSQRVFDFSFPEHKEKGIHRFPASYDRCYYSAIKSLLEKHDFEIVKARLSYFQSPYFAFLLPLFVVSALYEVLLYAFGVKNLCAYMLVVARKK